MNPRAGTGFAKADIAAILLSNSFVLALALWQRWPTAYLVWPYWFQSVVIGVLQIRRMLKLTHFSTKGFTSNGQPVPETRAALVSTTTFFALHYGLIHIVYSIFLLILAPAGSEWHWIFLGALAFAVSQTLGEPRRLAQDALGRPNLGAMMFLPYIRVVPMHLLVILGLALRADHAILLFGTLKTLGDVLSALAEARVATSGAMGTMKLSIKTDE